jgi:hypothetical protein
MYALTKWSAAGSTSLQYLVEINFRFFRRHPIIEAALLKPALSVFK